MAVAKRTAGEGRHRRRPGRMRSQAGLVELSDLDRRLLDLVSSQRLLTQVQLARLLADVPDRTLRYRTAGLCRLGLLCRTRPYRERGSAPFHLWPMRRGDALVRGDPRPRGGERREPNPLFVAHAAALSELYVALAAVGPDLGLRLVGFVREGEAREEFRSRGKRRAIVPDAAAILVDREERELRLLAEVDLGTMSHRRLRRKASGYATYVSERAFEEHHPFCPVLCLLTTSEQRVVGFLAALRSELGATGVRDVGLVAGAGAVALSPERALREAVLVGLEENRLSLAELLYAARAPYERGRAARARPSGVSASGCGAGSSRIPRRCAPSWPSMTTRFAPTSALRRSRRARAGAAARLRAQPRRARAGGALGARPRPRAGPSRPTPDRQAERAKPQGRRGAGGARRFHRERQLARVAELVRLHGDGPSLRGGARERIERGQLLSDSELEALPGYAERDKRVQVEQVVRRAAYLKLRELEARRLARERGLVARLARDRAGFYPKVDRRWLRLCERCGELAYPSPKQERSGLPEESERRCHYCGGFAAERFDPDRAPEVAAPAEESWR
jgi:hypothetical protein